eukprot:5644767-Alexandrium_andersonii.AAC.1
MSASLVGSEMCIRDRPIGKDGGEADGRQDASSICNAPVAGAGRTRGAAVSYTHLTLPTICSV